LNNQVNLIASQKLIQRINKLFDNIKNAKVEKGVEDVYKEALESYFTDNPIRYDYGCDGYLVSNIVYNNKTKVLRLIMEFKHDEDFGSKINQKKVLIQVLYYLKSFSLKSNEFPEVILVGDKDECFVLSSKQLLPYLDEKIDWSIAPSIAPYKNSFLLNKLAADNTISSHVFKIDKSFKFTDVIENIQALAMNMKIQIKLTEQNIATIYDYFIIKVIKEPNKYTVSDLVFIFINLIIDPIDNYIHPKRKNTLVMSNNDHIDINGDAYESFVDYYSLNYSPKEKEKITSISDRLYEDTQRRFRGEFYTPTVWADEANRMISEIYGQDWREKYVVWDCAWGTGNLTRDYYFSELYCSTIFDGDIVVGSKYNSNATKFQYDFLNDDIDILEGAGLLESMCKMPQKLLESLKSDKPFLFFINPPFATAGNAKAKDVKSKVGTGNTKVNKLMKKYNVGKSAQQLYAQFLYKILLLKRRYNLSNVKVAVFSNPLFLSGPSFEGFRKQFFEDFRFVKGMLLKAGNFYDVSNDWAISFSIWETGKNNDINTFNYDIKDISNDNDIVTIGKKQIYNLDGLRSAADWINIKELPKTKEIITLKSPVNPDKEIVKTDKEALAYFINDSNNIYANAQGVYLMSSKITRHIRTIPIYKEDIMQCLSLFSARKIIKSNWINQKDEYQEPNIKHIKYKEWERDSIVYSLFNVSSYQSSLRNIKSSGRGFNIFNELFFMSNEEIKTLADKYNNYPLYMDVKNYSNERYIYLMLKNIHLSKESRAVLHKAKELIRKSVEYREAFNNEFPHYQIDCWDAGWYQIKQLLNKYMKTELEEFEGIYLQLEYKMKNLIYEIGFLRN
jgi:hypothetical protein